MFRKSNLEFKEQVLSRVDYTDEEYRSQKQDYWRAFEDQYKQGQQQKKEQIKQMPIQLIPKQQEKKQIVQEVMKKLIFDPTCENSIPQQQELFQALDCLNQRFSRDNLKDILNALYQWMSNHKKARLQLDKPLLSCTYTGLNDKDRRAQMEQLMELMSNDTKNKNKQKCRVIRSFNERPILTNKGLISQKLSLVEKFNNIKDIKEYKIFQREIAAKAFCEKGYGIPKLRVFIKQLKIDMQITDKRYKTASCGLVNDAFRRMQKFLIEQCQQPLRIATCPQIKVLFTILMNCQDNINKQARTFIKFIKLVHRLEQVQIQEEQTIQQYCQFMEDLQVKSKKIKFKTDLYKFQPIKHSRIIDVTSNKYNVQEIWTPYTQNIFYDAFLIFKTISKVRDHFKQKLDSLLFQNKLKGEMLQKNVMKQPANSLILPNNAQHTIYYYLADYYVLNRKFKKIIRSGIRKIEVYIKQNIELPRLNKVYDQVVKAMFCTPEAAQAREAIIKVQKLKYCDKQLVTHAIHVINTFNKFKNNQWQSQKLTGAFDYSRQ